MNTPTIPTLTARHEKAAHNHTVGLPISEALYRGLSAHGLAAFRGGEWALTDRGCDLAAGRLMIKRGQIVSAK